MYSRISALQRQVVEYRAKARELTRSNDMAEVFRGHLLASHADGLESALYVLLQNPKSQRITEKARSYLQGLQERESQTA